MKEEKKEDVSPSLDPIIKKFRDRWNSMTFEEREEAVLRQAEALETARRRSLAEYLDY